VNNTDHVVVIVLCQLLR